MLHIFPNAKPEMPFVAFIAAIGTDKQRVVEKRLHEVFSPRTVKRCTAAVWAVTSLRSIEYEFHNAPFHAEPYLSYRRCEGAGDQPYGGQPNAGAIIVLAIPVISQ